VKTHLDVATLSFQLSHCNGLWINIGAAKKQKKNDAGKAAAELD
jgi:hypothetical protein